MSLVSELTKEQLEEYITTSHSYREVLRKIGYHCANGYLYKLVKNRAKELGITAQSIPLPNPVATSASTKKTVQDLRLSDEVELLDYVLFCVGYPKKEEIDYA